MELTLHKFLFNSLNFTLQIFGNVSLDSVPTYLTLKGENIAHTVIPLIIISFILISISKFLNPAIFKSLVRLLISTKNFDQIIKEELKLSSVSSIVLIVNYFFTASSCIFLSLYTSIDMNIYQLMVFAFSLPLGIILLQAFSFWSIGWMSKEIKVLTYPVYETFVVIELSGIFLFFTALVWVLNPIYSSIFLKFFILLTLAGYLFRTFKSFFSVLQRGASWYYIILYLCTLEILPLIVIYYYVTNNFIK